MTIDIICPLYNAEKYILSLDESIKKQKNVDIKCIKYILTESNDKSEDLLKSIKADYKKIGKDEFSHSLIREEAAFGSNSDIIVFITQDIIVEKDNWLYELVKDIENNNCQASYSRQICDNKSIEKYTREYNYPKKSFYTSKTDIKRLGLKTFFFSDTSSAILKKVFIELKGYDSKNLPINEDMYFAYKLIMNGYKIKYCAESEVIHAHKFTLKQYFDRYYLTGKFFKQNAYLNQYKVNESGANLAKYIFKRAVQDKNIDVLLGFLPNMFARFIGMKVGKE